MLDPEMIFVPCLLALIGCEQWPCCVRCTVTLTFAFHLGHLPGNSHVRGEKQQLQLGPIPMNILIDASAKSVLASLLPLEQMCRCYITIYIMGHEYTGCGLVFGLYT